MRAVAGSTVGCVAFALLVAGSGGPLHSMEAKRPKDLISKGDSVEVVSAQSDVMVLNDIVAKVKRGDTFDVVNVQGEWVAIEVQGISGWIRSESLKKAAAPARPVTPPEPSPRPAPRGELYALLVGVREYDATELKSLQYSEADVEALAATLPDLGYVPGNIVILTQARGARSNRLTPTVEHIRLELELLLSEAGPEDSVLVAMAGHGVQFRTEKDSYFCPSDAKLSDRKTLLALADIYKVLENCKAGGKTILIDACRNDPQTNLSRARQTVDLESVTRPQAGTLPGGVAAFFSCSAGQQAFEHPELKHGVFFHYVIEAFKGKADYDADNEITLAELELFTSKQVQRFVRTELAQRQVPERKGEARGLMVLGRLQGTSR